MEFTPLKGRQAGGGKQIQDEATNRHDLCLYLDPPSEEITLLECEEMVAERVQVMRIVERLKERYKLLSTPFKEAFAREVDAIQPLFTKKCGTSKIPIYRRRDLISHFMLRLACSMSVDLTQRFIAFEVDLFRIRFSYEPPSHVLQFLIDNKIKPDEVGEKERNELQWGLIHGNRIKPENLTSTTFYKIPFTHCRELVRSRKVFLHAGYCYATNNDFLHFLTQKLRLILSTSMNKQRVRIEELNEGDRLLPLLHGIIYQGTRPEDSADPSNRLIRPEQVDELSRTSFPPCMRFIHNRLRSDHHLKHFARLQYGLFLKGAGMPLDGSIAFFRQEFTKKMDIDKFDKGYVYNIRHMYGKEGNRIDHKPLSCPTIILNNPPGPSDCHGCPFRHTEEAVLAQRLKSMHISQDRVDKVTKMANLEHRYDIACTRVFEYTHDLPEGGLGRVITNPNEYFDLSRDFHEGKRSKTAAEPVEFVATQSQRV